ncbi:MAG TPA: aromatic amino acid lyase, partial [Rhizomicrobium sp.]|nr:aromatic amino acid lyase [Rhizomicrobium sp.]
MTDFTLHPGKTKLSLWRAIAEGRADKLVLANDAWGAVERSRATLETALASGEAIYGVNTGFGKLAQTRIPEADLKRLQRNLVLSHATGVGEPLSDAALRLVIALKIGSLARGHSGVRRVVVERLLDLFNKNVLPEIPEKGSVGASGDL